MSLTIQQILSDAKRLASRLKEHDTAADVLLSQTQSVYKQLDAMKQVGQIIPTKTFQAPQLAILIFSK